MSGVGQLRLPSPPRDYDQGYMARLTNTLELDKQTTLFSADSALDNAKQWHRWQITIKIKRLILQQRMQQPCILVQEPLQDS